MKFVRNMRSKVYGTETPVREACSSIIERTVVVHSLRNAIASSIHLLRFLYEKFINIEISVFLLQITGELWQISVVYPLDTFSHYIITGAQMLIYFTALALLYSQTFFLHSHLIVSFGASFFVVEYPTSTLSCVLIPLSLNALLWKNILI